MTPSDFVDALPGFSKLTYVEQIKRFCWFLGERTNARFTAGDIKNCFDHTGCPPPSSIAPFLKSLADRKPPFLRKRNNAFELTRHAREQLAPIIRKRETTIAVDQLLKTLPNQLSVKAERVYLEEALTCFRHNAFRAAIVMTWNLAYDHICNVVLNDPAKLTQFNSQLSKSYPKADTTTINARDDFEALKEFQVLQVLKSSGIVSGSVHKILDEKLRRRNIAAHPSGVTISLITTEEFILDLVQNVVLKF